MTCQGNRKIAKGNQYKTVKKISQKAKFTNTNVVYYVLITEGNMH